MTVHLSKMEIIGLLAARFGFTRYLELCTATTGNFYKDLDLKRLPKAHRLMYNCPADFDDGLKIDFRSENFNIAECLSAMSRDKLRFDIILVDGFHEYELAYRDLGAAFDLIDESGMLVVHDCLPPNAATAAPRFMPGEWCGTNYKAYLDFVHERRLRHCTVDTDYGCGIICKRDLRSHWAKLGRTVGGSFLDPSSRRRAARARRKRAWREWNCIGNDFGRAFMVLQAHQKDLLNLISCDEFLRGDWSSWETGATCQRIAK